MLEDVPATNDCKDAALPEVNVEAVINPPEVVYNKDPVPHPESYSAEHDAVPNVAVPVWELVPDTDNEDAVADPSVEVVHVNPEIPAVLQVNAPDVIVTVPPNVALPV